MVCGTDATWCTGSFFRVMGLFSSKISGKPVANSILDNHYFSFYFSGKNEQGQVASDHETGPPRGVDGKYAEA